MSDHRLEWPQPYAPRQQAFFRTTPLDFQVDEELGFEPEPGGEHVWLQIRKCGRNTEQVAGLLARHAGVSGRQVSYSGLKDRRALTTQWFSVHLPGKGRDLAEDWQLDCDADAVQVLAVARHGRKLRRGSHQGNRFRIALDGLDDLDAAQVALEWLAQNGAPNYFGEQRFGIAGSNLDAPAQGSRETRFQRGMRLSARRSWIFNEVLAKRVDDASWDRPRPGDAIQFAGSGSWYRSDQVDEQTVTRVTTKDAHPTGPLWGRGALSVSGEVLALEQEQAGREPAWCAALEQAGMKQERRALRLCANALQWAPDGRRLRLDFSLPRGAYATALLSAVFALQQAPREPAGEAATDRGSSVP